MEKIAWLPDTLLSNKFIELLKRIFECAGFENVSFSFLKKHPFKVDYLVLNFYENLHKKFGSVKLFYFIKCCLLCFFSFCHIKIIWVLNNRIPHSGDSDYSLRMMKLLVKKTYRIIIMSDDSIEVLNNINPKKENWENKIIKIVHPNYINIYDIKYEQNTDDGFLKLLFFGLVKEYKNVDLLIKIIEKFKNTKIRLTIAGKTSSEEYKQYILKICEKFDNIVLKLEFIDDEDLIQMIKQNDLIVLPYDKKSSLNSGSIILCCSCGRSFISPRIGTVKEFNTEELFYTYDYKDNNEHEIQLYESINKAYQDFITQKNLFDMKGKCLYDYVSKYNDEKYISEIIKKELVSGKRKENV